MVEQVNIFVFGSNLAGRHGKGAALYAKQHCGAVYGVGEGMQGSSYGIPTKGYKLETLSLVDIENSVTRFLAFAETNKDKRFSVTPIGCGLAGYQYSEIAPMFVDVLKYPEKYSNVQLPIEFLKVFGAENE